MRISSTDAVLLMAYGSPDRLDQVEAYYPDIRRGNPPTPELLQELIGRYRVIDGGSLALALGAGAVLARAFALA